MFCSCLNQPILIHQALSVSLQKRKLPQLFDYYMCEMGSKLHHSLLPFTQRAPLITNDNSKISEGCLGKMVGSFDRLLRHAGLQWQSIQSEKCIDEYMHIGQTVCVSCDTLEGNEKKHEWGTERKKLESEVHKLSWDTAKRQDHHWTLITRNYWDFSFCSFPVDLSPLLSPVFSLFFLCLLSHASLCSIFYCSLMPFALLPHWPLSCINTFH